MKGGKQGWGFEIKTTHMRKKNSIFLAKVLKMSKNMKRGCFFLVMGGTHLGEKEKKKIRQEKKGKQTWRGGEGGKGRSGRSSHSR